jgi:hypothetical protein
VGSGVDDVTYNTWESIRPTKMSSCARTSQSHVDLRQISAGSDLCSVGSILAPIKRTESGWLSELCLAESTDSFGRAEKAGVGGSTPSLATTFLRT